jgi:superfamily II DNA or RNA helicase
MKSLSHKGLGIPKSELTEEKMKEILKELTVKPIIMQDFDFGNNEFKVYRQNSTHLYVPKFYGLNKFKELKNELKKENSKEREGIDIDIKFNGQLRPDQSEFVDKLFSHISENDSCVASAKTGDGKCLAPGTLILMYSGELKKVEDIKTGDVIMGPDSHPRNILSIANGMEEMFEIIPVKGPSYTVNRSHILSLQCNYGPNKNKIVNISVDDYLNKPKSFKHIHKGYRVPIEFNNFQDIHIDPYIIGLWLGDGCSAESRITSQDATILHYLANKLPEYDCYLQYVDKYGYRINGKQSVNFFWNSIRMMNLHSNKHIPHNYKCHSRENRLKLLAGILDTDGHYTSNGVYEIIQKNYTLANDIEFLARSLGFSANMRESRKSWIYKGEKFTGTYYRTTISGSDTDIEKIPCLIPRKQARIPITRKQAKSVLNYGFSIKSKNIGKYYGFEIDGDRRFVLGDFTVTHNTTIALNLVSKIKKKTLIIVHKEFLMNQWIERINQFLPNSRIGMIQQNKIEIADKDLVIGMLQSIAMREYDPVVFDEFGFVVFDEAHHICSKTFSQVLFKIATKKMIGLSATPIRKDGLTKVLTWFSGPIISKEQMNKDISVPEVIMISAKYAEEIPIKYTINRKINIPDLITKISLDPVRNSQISDIVIKFSGCGSGGSSRKILCLSERRQHCYDLRDEIIKKGFIGTIGIYIGGMSNEELEESNKCDVIIGTYQSISEGYDNSSLDTVVLCTSKSDIIQSIGRILRKKNKNHPLIIDICDENLRVGQIRTRKKFYKSQKFIITEEKKENREIVEKADIEFRE